MVTEDGSITAVKDCSITATEDDSVTSSATACGSRGVGGGELQVMEVGSATRGTVAVVPASGMDGLMTENGVETHTLNTQTSSQRYQLKDMTAPTATQCSHQETVTVCRYQVLGGPLRDLMGKNEKDMSHLLSPNSLNPSLATPATAPQHSWCRWRRRYYNASAPQQHSLTAGSAI